MISLIASFACFAFVILLFAREFRLSKDQISWIPFAWMFIAGSRFVSTWLDLRAPGGVNAYADGSPVDRAVFLTLIVCGLIVLYRRKMNWGTLFSRNRLLLFYLVYCLVSLVWADDGYVLTKRWIKDLGNPIIVLILLTERQPYQAIVTTLIRLSFLFVPVSVLFIKYYPELGRGYAAGGAPMYTGVGDQKNALGLICLTTGMAYLWSILYATSDYRLRPNLANGILAASLVWLLYMANSQTSLVCLLVVCGILLVSRRRMIDQRPKRLFNLVAISVTSLTMLNWAFDIRSTLIEFLGRDSTLTNRTTIWSVVGALQPNPVIGAGFMSFWAGPRLTIIAKSLGTDGLNQAHNGYLEQYLNLGYIGVAFIISIAAVALVDIRNQSRTDYSVATLRLCILAAALLYNYTEASFYGINNMWVLFLAASIDRAGLRSSVASSQAPIPRLSSLRESVHIGKRRFRGRTMVPARVRVAAHLVKSYRSIGWQPLNARSQAAE